ncbi:type 1 glutamine amidotransferase domain-containing protein [Kribbella sp. NPDC056861]|uniref:type 1 glutamine amidotransferase domain-containing protein n=1 Tax=Kribbella sp. NPDC056861 TaxID=3154857 RepID=UPI003448401D
MGQRALFVLTSHGELGDTGRPTGFHLGETSLPWQELTAAGHRIDLASVEGGRPPMVGHDPEQPSEVAFLADPLVQVALGTTIPADEVDPGNYRLVYFVGGHGGMWDFHGNSVLHTIARSVYEAGGVVAAICHGPAVLVDLELSDGSRLVTGKWVTSFPEVDEAARGLDIVVPFSLQGALEDSGAFYSSGPDKTAHVVTDGRLITGQNPASAAKLARCLVDVWNR